MGSHWMILKFMLAMILTFPFFLCLSARGENGHVEVENYEDAIDLAVKDSRRVYLVFKGQSCPWCDTQAETLSTPEAAAAMGRVVLCFIDAGKRRDLVRKYGVTAVPDHHLLDSEGNSIRSSVGYKDVGGVGKFLED